MSYLHMAGTGFSGLAGQPHFGVAKQPNRFPAKAAAVAAAGLFTFSPSSPAKAQHPNDYVTGHQTPAPGQISIKKLMEFCLNPIKQPTEGRATCHVRDLGIPVVRQQPGKRGTQVVPGKRTSLNQINTSSSQITYNVLGPNGRKTGERCYLPQPEIMYQTTDPNSFWNNLVNGVVQCILPQRQSNLKQLSTGPNK
jgi:hypothetical protein